MIREENGTDNEKRISDEYRALIYLIGCALNDLTPDEDEYLKADAGTLYRIAKRHSVISLTAHALSKNGYKGMDAAMADRFKKAAYKAVRKNILLNTECEVILSYMESEGIKYLPLKGIILQNLYPEPKLRQMTDNDILYDNKYHKELRSFMEGRGYTFKKEEIHDSYYKEPIYNYEMHSRLFLDATAYGAYSGYYKDIWERVVSDDGKRYGYHLKDEDLYVYLTAHAEKHYYGAGTGIRTLADFYVMNRSFTEIDRKYVVAELGKLGLVEFEDDMRHLSDKLFSLNFTDLTDKEYGMIARILNSGTYGTEEQRVAGWMMKWGMDGRMSGSKRFVYYMKRLFPDQKILVPYYPLARYKLFIPVIWIFRAIRGVIIKHKKIRREIEIVMKEGNRH